jgi:putative Mg2+ transporter-C (MgtC) family protein
VELLPAWIDVLRLPVLGRLLLALALGAAVGLERELSGKPAGLRTNILICVGAALFTELSILVAHQFAGHDLIRADPGRVAAQIVSGIGFIGAGTILVSRGNVLGLTTAATLWVVAAIGMAVGLQLYVEAVGGAVLVVITLFALGHLEEAVILERTERILRVIFDDPDADPSEVEAAMGELGLDASRLGHERKDDRAVFSYVVRGTREAKDRLLERLSRRRGVRGSRLE